MAQYKLAQVRKSSMVQRKVICSLKKAYFRTLNIANVISKLTSLNLLIESEYLQSIFLSLIVTFPISSDSPKVENQYCCEFLRTTIRSNIPKQLELCFYVVVIHLIFDQFCYAALPVPTLLFPKIIWNKSPQFHSWRTRNVHSNSKMHLSSQHFIQVI